VVVGVVVDGVDGLWGVFVKEVIWEGEYVWGVGEEFEVLEEQVVVAGEGVDVGVVEG